MGRPRKLKEVLDNPIVASGDNFNKVLRNCVGRIETLEEEKRSVQTAIKEVFAEAKVNGIEKGILKKIIAERRLDENVRIERLELMQQYREALGMLDGTPLGEAAMEAAA